MPVGIGYRKSKRRAAAGVGSQAAGHGYRAVFRKFEGVSDNVVADLRQPKRVAGQIVRNLVPDIQDKIEPAFLALVLIQVADGIEESAQGEGRRRNGEFTGFLF